MGAIALLLLLEGQLDPHDALDAVDAWDGDAYVGFTATGTRCVRVAIATRRCARCGRLDQLLTEWSAAAPQQTPPSPATTARSYLRIV